MSEIKPCRICSTSEKKVMPEIEYDFDGVTLCECEGCELTVNDRSSSDPIEVVWNAFQDRISAKIESVAAEREQAARKAERVKAVEEFCASLMDYAAKYYDSSTVADVRAVECTGIRAVAEKVKAK